MIGSLQRRLGRVHGRAAELCARGEIVAGAWRVAQCRGGGGRPSSRGLFLLGA
jgi:hypothetical protein